MFFPYVELNYATIAIHKGLEKARTLAGFDLTIFNNLSEELRLRMTALQQEGEW